jgi:hypothetical protein
MGLKLLARMALVGRERTTLEDANSAQGGYDPAAADEVRALHAARVVTGWLYSRAGTAPSMVTDI